MDAVRGTARRIDRRPTGAAAPVPAWVPAWVPARAAAIGTEGLVSDAADPFKTAAAGRGVPPQVGTAHVVGTAHGGRTPAAWVAARTPALAVAADGSWASLGGPPEQAGGEGQDRRRRLAERPPTAEASALLATSHRRYLGAATPPTGGPMALA